MSRRRRSPPKIGPPGPSTAEIYGPPLLYTVPPWCVHARRLDLFVGVAVIQVEVVYNNKLTDQTSVQGAVIDLTKQEGMLDDVDEHKWLEI